jgi:hypothetical protein
MARAATSRLKVNPALGTPPSLEWRAVGELLIDSSYQREIDTGPSQTLIRRIAMFWDWGLCQPLAVSRRPDGLLLIVDGQHRASAAKLRGDIPHLPCVITNYASAGDEAAAFVALNQQRRPLSALDLFKAAVAAEDKEALLITECLASAGCSMAPHSNINSWKPGMLQNVGGLKECLRTKGEEILREALIILGEAYRGERLRYAGTIFPGIAHIVWNEHQRSTEEKFGARMIAMVKTSTQKEWAARIVKLAPEHFRGRRGAAWQVFAEAWRDVQAPSALPIIQATQGSSAPVILDKGEIAWCAQCDQKVSGEKAARCTDRYCSMRKAEAA